MMHILGLAARERIKRVPGNLGQVDESRDLADNVIDLLARNVLGREQRRDVGRQDRRKVNVNLAQVANGRLA
jgi:hypothetical protein